MRERKPGAPPFFVFLFFYHASAERWAALTPRMAFLFVEGLSWQAPRLAEEQAFFSSASRRHFHTDDRHTAALNTRRRWKWAPRFVFFLSRYQLNLIHIDSI